MLIREFPDIQWLKKQIKEGFGDKRAVGGIVLENTGWPSVVLNTSTSQAERKDIKGPFSFFMNLQGSSHVRVEGKEQTINEQCYALSNAGQHYDLLIDETTPTEIFNVHFGEQFFKKSIYSFRHKTEYLLDNPFGHDTEELNLHLHTRPRSQAIDQLVKRLNEAYREGTETIREEELLFDLLNVILKDTSQESRQQATLPVKSKAVREEVCQRLFSARDFIHAHYHETLSLDVLAQVSCLSKFHFLRLFKALFQQTPYQYQKQLRFRQCLNLYHQGFTLEEIAPKIGMDNASSVSRMFHKQAGVYPSQLVHE